MLIAIITIIAVAILISFATFQGDDFHVSSASPVPRHM